MALHKSSCDSPQITNRNHPQITNIIVRYSKHFNQNLMVLVIKLDLVKEVLQNGANRYLHHLRNQKVL